MAAAAQQQNTDTVRPPAPPPTSAAGGAPVPSIPQNQQLPVLPPGFPVSLLQQQPQLMQQLVQQQLLLRQQQQAQAPGTDSMLVLSIQKMITRMCPLVMDDMHVFSCEGIIAQKAQTIDSF